MAFADFKRWLLSLVGDREDSDQTVKGYMDQLSSKTHVYTWARRDLVSAEFRAYIGQTVSLSASQPISEDIVFAADKKCIVDEMIFMPYVSATVTDTETMAYHIVVNKRGGGEGTYSSTYSVTTYVGGTSSATDKHGTASKSFSTLTQNVARAPNRLHLADVDSRTLTKGDVLTVRVDKGSGSANDSGAIFRGGKLRVRVREE